MLSICIPHMSVFLSLVSTISNYSSSSPCCQLCLHERPRPWYNSVTSRSELRAVGGSTFPLFQQLFLMISTPFPQQHMQLLDQLFLSTSKNLFLFFLNQLEEKQKDHFTYKYLFNIKRKSQFFKTTPIHKVLILDMFPPTSKKPRKQLKQYS